MAKNTLRWLSCQNNCISGLTVLYLLLNKEKMGFSLPILMMCHLFPQALMNQNLSTVVWSMRVLFTPSLALECKLGGIFLMSHHHGATSDWKGFLKQPVETGQLGINLLSSVL